MSSNLTYDVQGTTFTKGVTNFTVANYLKAKQQFGLVDKPFILLFHTALHNKLQRDGVLRKAPFFDGMPVVYTDHAEYINRSTFVTTFISTTDHILGKMVTRETP